MTALLLTLAYFAGAASGVLLVCAFDRARAAAGGSE
jgi:hypothetical protein